MHINARDIPSSEAFSFIIEIQLLNTPRRVHPAQQYSSQKYKTLFSTTEDEQDGNPIHFANDFLKLDSHLTIKAKFILRID